MVVTARYNSINFSRLQIPGAVEYGATSDDLFWLKKTPGKT